MKQNLELFFATMLSLVMFYCYSEVAGYVNLYHCFLCMCWYIRNYMNVLENRDFYYGRKDIQM